MSFIQSTTVSQSTWRGYVLSAGICVALALPATALLPYVDLANIVMLFLLAVFLIAVSLGRGAAVLSAFLSVAVFDYCCVPPQFSFAVSHVQYLITFTVMLAVALITGQLAASLRLQAELARQREQRTQALYEMARQLSGSITPREVNDIVSGFIHDTTGMDSALLLPQGDTLEPVGNHTVWYETHMAWAAYEGERHGLLAEPDGLYYMALKGATRMRGVLVLALPQHVPVLTDENRGLLVTVASLIAIAVERLHYVEIAYQHETQVATERLRSSILSALSHDLRTPLTVLVGQADALAISKPPLSARQQETAETLRDQSLRLSGMVANLLDMARLQSGEVVLRKEWQPIEEVIGASIQMLGKALEQYPVTVHIAPDLPMLEFDAVLMERVFCNLLENAAKYSPVHTAIDISVEVDGDYARISISDQGCGIPADRLQDIFKMFVRGHAAETSHRIAGTGIGLAVCEAIITAHQGIIAAENLATGGACIRFTLPLGNPPQFDADMLEASA